MIQFAIDASCSSSYNIFLGGGEKRKVLLFFTIEKAFIGSKFINLQRLALELAGSAQADRYAFGTAFV